MPNTYTDLVPEAGLQDKNLYIIAVNSGTVASNSSGGSGDESSSSPAPNLSNGQTLVNTTATLITTPNATGQGIMVKSLSANTGLVYIGGSGVTSGNGFPISPGEGLFLNTSSGVYGRTASGIATVAFIGVYS